ncbi:hypothetical protein CRM22_004192 [Opisthorchis felineus]|uniref:Small ribosomal subunit protein mS29 n=1 Tax=Opisthorchis felineus TaxID=147828 RepID=A0A4S2LY95_OPIFE|nr:hypothetical protein CRM22_004192 [Opisthorchis felineus]TGZ68586.1 hypothetical protein CRM22_004192 [Opisthorchis felineus]TGZ68587.1 hypothetical protein CRM22_004192 [Opisthorchis felineus]
MRGVFLHTFRRCAATLAEFNQCAPRTSITVHTEQLKNMSSVLHKFVSYPVGDFDRFISPFLKAELVEELATFGDYSLLIRRPSLSIMKDLLRIRELQTHSSDDTSVSDDLSLQSHAVPRFVTYGQPGTGISVTLAQISHFAATNNWLVFPFPDAEKWLYRCVDLTPSNEYHQDQHKPNLVGDAFDYPSRSANWLQGFVKMNEGFLEKNKPLTTRDVHWTRVDSTPAGTPWTELIKFCIARKKYSTDCIGILLREMRSLCSQPDGPPCLVIVDGVNFLWCRGTLLKDKTLHCRVTVDRLAIVHHLRRVLRADWRHGAILTSLNIRAAWPTDREKYTPGYLLGKDGFECMDPFIPIPVENYTSAEVDACLRFYAENHWLTNPAAHTPAGRAEIVFLADSNPLELGRVVAEW